MPLVNVGIICGDSRDRLTEQCIRSFYENTDQGLCNLSILSNSVPEATSDLLLELKQEYNFRLMFGGHYGGGQVTNKLLNFAREDKGKFLYHTASDFYFKPGWLDALLTNWPICEQMGIGLLGGYSHPYHKTKFVVRGVSGFDIHEKDMVAGGSWFMPWTVWDKFGPLNELHKGVWIGSEDSEFNFRLIAAGVGRATLVPEVVIHTGRTASNGQPTLGAEFMPDVDGVIIE